MNDTNSPAKKPFPLLIVLAVVGLALVGSLLFGVFVGKPMWDAAQEQITINRMKVIAIGMHNYHDTHQMFPRAAFQDEEGKPFCSWRAMISYIDESDLFKQYDRQQPWDSPGNLRFARETPEAFRSPQCDCSDGKTPFVVVVGPNTMFPADQQLDISECKDGRENTLLLIADLENPVPWSEPKDLSLEDFLKRYSSQVTDQKPLYVALVHAGMVRISKIAPEDLENLAVRNDGQTISFEGRTM